MEDPEKAKAAPNMSSLFGSDSEDEENEAIHPDSNKATTDKEEDDSEDDDVEFREDDITGKSAPRNRIRAQPKPPVRFSNSDEYDDSNQRSQTYPDDDELVETLPPRQIILSEAPAIVSTGETSALTTYASSSKAEFTFHLVQLPKIVTINPEQYDAASFDAEAEEREFKRPVHNMIRWRYVSNDDSYLHESEMDRESNANIIQWSDGTFGLAIGDEVFELDEFPFSSSTADTKTPVASSATSKEDVASKDFLYLSSKAQLRQRDESKELDDDDIEDTKISTILQCIVPLQSKLIPRPSSIQSSAHKAFVLAEKARNAKRANIGEYVPVMDPELEKAERIRNNEDLSKQKKRYSSGEARSSFGGSRRSSGPRFEENDDQYDSINLKDLKRKSRDMDNEDDYGDDDDDDEEDEWSKRKRKLFLNNRVGRPSSSSDEDGSAEEDKIVATRKKSTKSVFAEDDDDD